MSNLAFNLFCMQEAEKSYLLTCPPYKPGLFSIFNTVIGCLDVYDREQWDGLKVNFQKVGNFYDEGYGPNWWEYYFEPINFGSVNEATANKFETYKKIIFSLTAEFELSRTRAHELINKYVTLKPDIQKEIDQFVKYHFKGHHVIGIHYRGTDKKSEAPCVAYEEVYEQIKKAIDKNPNKDARIFVATDDAHFFHFMQQKFPDKAFGIDAIRSTDGTPVHQNTVQKDNYKKGKDAVMDCILLSKCQLLIKMASNLSDCSMQFNPHVPVIHLNRSYNE